MKITRMFLLALAAIAVAGCSSGGSSGGGGGSETTAGGKVDGISVANCLNLEDFLVQPSETTLTGQAPSGVSFAMQFYKDAAAAKAVYAKKNKKTTAIVENAIVDFKGNPSPYAGAPPAKISQNELGVIKKCIGTSKEST
jgi:hypothetical protein